MIQLKSIWESLYKAFGENEFIFQVIGGYILSLSVFWITSGLFAVVDITGKPEWMAKYKSQPGKNQPVDREKLVNAIRVVVRNQVINFPAALIFYWLRKSLGCSYHPDDIPPGYIILRDMAAFVVVEEIGFYYTHRLMHYGPLYKVIHKQHHEWTAPIGLVAIYAHPIEFIVCNLAPFLAGPLVMKSHLLTTWLWFAVGQMTTIIHHSGYHLPFLPSNEFHDYHHLKFNNNYGLTGWLDWLHGTDQQFRQSHQHKKDHMLLGIQPAS